MKKIIYLLTVSLIFVGCEDFLDTTSYTTKDGSSFPKNEEDATQLVVGCYNNFSNNFEPFYSYMLFAECACDDRLGGGGYHDRQPQAMCHLEFSDLDLTNNFWNRHYQGIARENVTLEALEDLEQTPNIIHMKNEVKVLRALNYFELVQLMGDVPLMREIPRSVQEARDSPPQATQEELFRFIAQDLWDAYNELPVERWNALPSGTINKWYAAGLLARVYLFYTGFYSKETLPMESGGEVTREQVRAALENLMNNSGHSLVPNFYSLWSYTSDVVKKDYPFAKDMPSWVRDSENPEHVFLRKGSKSNNRSPYNGNEFCLYWGVRNGGGQDYRKVFPLGEGWGFGPVNTTLWEQWIDDDPNDLRRKASIWHFEEETYYDDVFASDRSEVFLDESTYAWGIDRQCEETGLWNKKIVATRAYGKGDGTGLWSAFTSHPEMYNNPTDHFQIGNATDICLIRYADILLMHSEITKTADGMNAVRARVNLPPVAYSDEALRKERRYELAFEGLRWGDIRRWHIAEEVLPSIYGVRIYVEGNFTTERPQGTVRTPVDERYRATKGFWMIPQTQIDLSFGVLKQNPGWGPEAAYGEWRE